MTTRPYHYWSTFAPTCEQAILICLADHPTGATRRHVARCLHGGAHSPLDRSAAEHLLNALVGKGLARRRAPGWFRRARWTLA